MAEFLDTFDVERGILLQAVDHFEQVWARFQERRALDLEGSELSDSMIASELILVRRELEAKQFTVGVFGLIKRGKSTLMNSMVGQQVSEMHVTPETAVPVYVTYADSPQATIHFADGDVRHVAVEDVAQYTSQKHNQNNRLGVTYVHQEVPVGFLKNGTRLIDTPGLDDAEADEVYTERTMQELDVCDAGVIVFLSPPTVGATELGFLEKVVGRDLKKTFLVCNMYPQHFHDPETRTAVLNYVGQRIVEASIRAGKRGEVRVYPVCALEAWQARADDDIDLWKKSGADRLMRDIELYLSDRAGAQALQEAAERVVHAADMATGEVQVRQRLLEDREQLAEHRAKLDERVRELEGQFKQAVSLALQDIGPLKMRIRGLMLQPFPAAKRKVDGLESIEEVEQFAKRFKREVEVAGELASRQFADGFNTVVERIRTTLENQFQALMGDFAPNLPAISIGKGSLLVTPDQLKALQESTKRSKGAALASSAVAGLAGGGLALTAASALLGPIGLLGGALVGWKLSDVVVGGKGLGAARESIKQRVDEISLQLTADFDKQVDEAVDTLRKAVDRRQKLFAADLYKQFELVESLSDDPALVDSYTRDAERFVAAFKACASRARNAVSLQPVV
ncbi:MAG TPA: dynamin family protein [Nitriliruptorales bacterium]